LRSIGIERCTPKFLKKLGNPAFSKTCGRRFPPPLYQYATIWLHIGIKYLQNYFLAIFTE
ncbi:MAG: hypothetical protein LBC63_04100, partial [Holophagales bacterium]|nr:hypothetical protein [Holophagales bacterium]